MNKNSNYIVVQTTTDSINVARKLVNILLADRLIACGQISEIESYYCWKNKVHNTKEYRVIMKTKRVCTVILKTVSDAIMIMMYHLSVLMI